MERMTGFEPATHGLGSRCPTTGLHPLVIYSMDLHYTYYTHPETDMQVSVRVWSPNCCQTLPRPLHHSLGDLLQRNTTSYESNHAAFNYDPASTRLSLCLVRSIRYVPLWSRLKLKAPARSASEPRTRLLAYSCDSPG